MKQVHCQVPGNEGDLSFILVREKYENQGKQWENNSKRVDFNNKRRNNLNEPKRNRK